MKNMVKRIFVILFGSTFFCLSVMGMEFKNGISSGGFFVMEDDFGEGYGEWSFPIARIKNFMIRDCASIGGFGKSTADRQIDFGGMSVGNTVHFGGIFDSQCFRIKSYGLIGAEFSLFSGIDHPLFCGSAMLGSIIGGGFEFQYTEKNAFAIEFGGKYRYVIGKDMNDFAGYNSINPVIIIGYRSYY